MIVTGGVNWEQPIRPLMEISVGYGFVITLYVAVMVLVVLNIVTGIFVNDAVEMAQLDRDLASQAEMERTRAVLKELQKLFTELDENQSGGITKDEFEARMQNNETRHFFSALGLDVSNANEVFNLMDVDGGGELEIDEFVIGCMQLKGGAKAVDMESLMRENRRLMKRWNKDTQSLRHQVSRLEAALVPFSTLQGSGRSRSSLQNSSSASPKEGERTEI